MNITIGNPVSMPNYKECYVIEITFTHGDGDIDEKVEMGEFKKDSSDMIALEDALIVCENMMKAFPDGRNGEGDYTEELVPGFNKWFQSQSKNKWSVSIPADCTCDFCSDATFSEYVLYYYDENGVKYNTKIDF